MLKKQKLNIIRSTQRDFEIRLRELQRAHNTRSYNDTFINDRLRELDRGIKYCNYLHLCIRHSNKIEPDNYYMLEYCGLDNLMD